MRSRNPAVADANVLFDFLAAAALAALARLRGGVVVTDLVLAEARAEQQNDIRRAPVSVHGLDERQLDELAQLAVSERKLSIPDLSSFIVARDGHMILLTGEKLLRARAEAGGVEVHGTIWILDQLIGTAILDPQEAADALAHMVEEGRRLPEAESRAAIERWRQHGGH